MNAINFRNRLLSLLIEEFEKYIPQFKPYSLDYQVVVYASKDLETWLKVKLNTNDTRMIYKKLKEYFMKNPRDLKISMNFWVGMWLKKWRERVRILSTKFKVPKKYAEKVKKARTIYKHMDYRSELKNIAIKKLVNQGEICMVEFIAENLIIEEIAKRIQKSNRDSHTVLIDPLSIYNAINSRIARLSRDKGPLVYLNIKPNIF